MGEPLKLGLTVGIASLALTACGSWFPTHYSAAGFQRNTPAAVASSAPLGQNERHLIALAVGDHDRSLKTHPFPLSCASGDRGVICWRTSYCAPPDFATQEGFPFCPTSDARMGETTESVHVPAITQVTALSTGCALGTVNGSRGVVCWDENGATTAVPAHLVAGDDSRFYSGGFGHCVISGGQAQCWREGSSALVTLPALHHVRDLAITGTFLFFISDEGVSYAKYPVGANTPASHGPIVANFKPVHISALDDARYPGIYFNGCVVGEGEGASAPRHCFDEQVLVFPDRVDPRSMFNHLDGDAALGIVWSGDWVETSCAFDPSNAISCTLSAYTYGDDKPVFGPTGVALPQDVVDFLR